MELYDDDGNDGAGGGRGGGGGRGNGGGDGGSIAALARVLRREGSTDTDGDGDAFARGLRCARLHEHAVAQERDAAAEAESINSAIKQRWAHNAEGFGEPDS